jgi:hypothetical protein
MRNIKFTNTGNGYVGICRFLDESDLFQSYVQIKTQPKDQLKSWEVPTLLYKWERQLKKFQIVQQGQCSSID